MCRQGRPSFSATRLLSVLLPAPIGPIRMTLKTIYYLKREAPRRRSLMPERNHRIDLRRPPRRDVTCRERHYSQKRGYTDVRQRVARRDLEEQSSQQARDRNGSQQPDCYADQRQTHPLPEYPAQNRAGISPQRQANPDLARSL